MWKYAISYHCMTCLCECCVNSVSDCHCQVVCLSVFPVEATGQDHVAILPIDTERIVLIAI